jgi:putative transposase
MTRRRLFRSNKNVVYSCLYHLVFCPKYRRPVLVDGVAKRLKEIVATTAEAFSTTILEMAVLPDQVQLLVEVDPQFGIHRLVKQIKGHSSQLLRNEFPALRRRLPTLWTNSYFVATIDGALLAIVKQYIENQKQV